MKKRKVIEWHPAFEASIQIEFENEIDKMTFEPEHLLSKLPMRIDELVIKLRDDEKIEKNIGRIFRKHNIIEYKSPEDNLTINDFYKVYGYCCFYQSDTEHVCEIRPEELTITFICNHYPKKMIHHLKEFQKFQIKPIEPGIYYIFGDAIPMQLIITKELDKEKNQWLCSLRNDITDKVEIENLVKRYEEKKNSKLYQAAMEAITRANWEAIKEVKSSMCEALKELMAEEFQEMREQVTEQVTKQVTEQLTEQFIMNAYASTGDTRKVSDLLKIPVEIVEKTVAAHEI